MINNIPAVHISNVMSFQDIDRGEVLNADKATQNFCGVPYRHNKEFASKDIYHLKRRVKILLLAPWLWDFPWHFLCQC